jgi:hypothetical protein
MRNSLQARITRMHERLEIQAQQEIEEEDQTSAELDVAIKLLRSEVQAEQQAGRTSTGHGANYRCSGEKCRADGLYGQFY